MIPSRALLTGWERCVYNDTTILTANAAPTGIAVTPAVVAENQPIGTTVGPVGSADASGEHAYLFAGDRDR